MFCKHLFLGAVAELKKFSLANSRLYGLLTDKIVPEKIQAGGQQWLAADGVKLPLNHGFRQRKSNKLTGCKLALNGPF